ncbi:hypothetical protein EON67_01855 [archaeon]|nr:MAG: hypothetical protein EON67_01855 [archaeon]
MHAGVDAKFKEVDLSPSQDEFYRELMFLNFADACGLVSSRVKQHMDEKGLRMDLSTMDAMESAIAKLPDLQRQNFTMLKHYQIISEINKIVSARRTWCSRDACRSPASARFARASRSRARVHGVIGEVQT